MLRICACGGPVQDSYPAAIKLPAEKADRRGLRESLVRVGFVGCLVPADTGDRMGESVGGGAGSATGPMRPCGRCGVRTLLP